MRLMAYLSVIISSTKTYWSPRFLFFITALTSALAHSSSHIECEGIIFPELVDKPRIEGFTVDYKNLDWEYSDLPLRVLRGKCKLNGPSLSQIAAGDDESILLRSAGYDGVGYFFYINRCLDGLYCVSWNGHKESQKAQWLITEQARMSTAGNKYCFRDHRVSICLTESTKNGR